jgi:predicted nucleotide-binding protein
MVRLAARLAHLTGEPEYAALFEIHLDGIPAGPLADHAEGRVNKWKDQAVPPRWNPAQAFLLDRRLMDGQSNGSSVAHLEEMLRQMEPLKTDGAIFQNMHDIKLIKAKIRNRVGIFANAIEGKLDAAPGPPPMLESQSNVFIGHGRSLLWLKVKEFLVERLRLPASEFNRESTAGIATVQRLQTLLSEAQFAFLIMTAEDRREDGSLHARENVVHEAGLFQGRLGFQRAIILLEEGCEEFSNIHGLGQIRFAPGRIEEAFEPIRQVLEREGIMA